MKFAKVREVKSPNRGTKLSAGLDFYTPKFTPSYLLDVAFQNKYELDSDQIYIDSRQKVIILAPGAHVKLPSGIKTNLESLDGVLVDRNECVAFIAYNKSGIATNKRLDVGASVVDQDYQGELHFSLVNTSNRLIKVQQDEKILQFVAMKTILSEPKETSETDLFSNVSERGGNGFGSKSDQI